MVARTGRLICRTLAKRKAQMRNKGLNIFNVFFTSLVVAENQLGNDMLVFGSRDNGLWGRSEGDIIWNRLDPTETERRTRTNTVSDTTMPSMSKRRSIQEVLTHRWCDWRYCTTMDDVHHQ